MQTIETRYHASTTHRASKITATASGSGKRVSMSPEGRTTDAEDHAAAAVALCERLGWFGKMVGGHTKRWIIRAALVVLFWVCVVVWFCISSGCGAVAHEVVGCHPGQHRCQTDAECEDEEAYFLDAEEGRQL